MLRIACAVWAFLLVTPTSAGSEPSNGPWFVATSFTVPGSLQEIRGISDAGHVAGMTLYNKQSQAFSWRDGVTRFLPSLPPPAGGQPYSRALDANSRGQVVGASCGEATFWDNGTPVDISGSGLPGECLCINNLGQAVGVLRPRNGQWMSVIWNDGVKSPLVSLPNAFLDPRGINDLGQVIGSLSGPDLPVPSGSCIVKGGILTPLALPPGCTSASPSCINNRGDVAGTCHLANQPWDSNARACVWRNGGAVILPLLPGTNRGYAFGISDRGWVLGSCGDWNPCIWVDDIPYDLPSRILGADNIDIAVARSIGAGGEIAAMGITEPFARIGLVLAPLDHVEIDVRPLVEPNVIEMSSRGVVHVAVLGSPEFDASTLDAPTVRFAGAAPIHSTLVDVERDGDSDMVLLFKTQDLQLVAEDCEATLTGRTSDRHVIEGKDEVVVFGVPPGPVPPVLRYYSRVVGATQYTDDPVLDINEAGVIAGTNRNNIPCLWRLDGTSTLLPLLLGAKSGQATAINNHGTVVGWSTMLGNTGWAWTWNEATGLSTLGEIAGLAQVQPQEISDSGFIVGWGISAAGSTETAFRIAPNGNAQLLPPLSGGNACAAISVNEAGVAAGWSALPNGGRHACMWGTDAIPSDLGTLGMPSSSALAINDPGTVVGYTSSSNQTAAPAFVWTSKDGMRDLVGHTERQYMATDVNNRGLVVGISPGRCWYPFVWTEETGMVELEIGYGATPLAVSDAGIIVGAAHGNLVVWEPVSIPVTIDIRPLTDPNVINPKSKGIVPVAILTTPTFDADIVNGPTSTFAGARPVWWWMVDVDRDGDKDLLLHFQTEDLQLTSTDTTATLTAITKDDREVIGTDTVRVK